MVETMFVGGDGSAARMWSAGLGPGSSRRPGAPAAAAPTPPPLAVDAPLPVSGPSADDLAAGDPSGTKTGTANDVVHADPNKPLTLVDLVNQAGQNRIAINFVWTLVTGFLVMFMQAGFAIVETGLCRAKNANHTMMMNFMVYGFGLFAYWVCGFAIQMGGAAGISILGGVNPLSHEFTIHLLGTRLGPVGHARVSSWPARPMTSASWSCSCSRWSSWIRRSPS